MIEFIQKHGSKTQKMMEGDGWSFPLSVIVGQKPGPTVLLVSGVHGGEYVAILSLIELAKEITPAQISGRLIMLHPVNTRAFWERQGTVMPQDGQNLNRSFPGNAQGGPTARLANILTGLILEADFYLDLHTADLFENTSPLACYPATGTDEITNFSRQWAQMANVPFLIKSTLPGAGITEAAKCGKPALLLKRGGPGGLCPQKELELYKNDIRNLLRYVKVLEGMVETPTVSPQELVPHYVLSPQKGLWRPRVQPGQKIEAGTVLGELNDFFGQCQQTFQAQAAGVVLYSLQALSANQDDILVVY